MKYYIDGIMYELPDLTAEEKEYLTLANSKEEAISWKNISYDEAVDREIRKKYAQHQVEAILNNYLAEPDNEKYIEEFKQLQEYRKECKAYVKEKKALYENFKANI